MLAWLLRCFSFFWLEKQNKTDKKEYIFQKIKDDIPAPSAKKLPVYG
ncbi:MAG: hypothetical protein MI745_10645 [Pseudomonadales bacterium]|nr:hypothetical protein [Pseudomonadales bacterium]